MPASRRTSQSRIHPARHDRTREQGALANPAPTPRRTNGYVFSTAGDAFAAAFTSPTDTDAEIATAQAGPSAA